MEGLNGGDGEGEEVPRPRMWYEVGGQVEIQLARLLRIRQQRTDYDNPEYWRRLRRERREREAMQREEVMEAREVAVQERERAVRERELAVAAREVAVNRVAEEEAVLPGNELVLVVQEAEVNDVGVDMDPIEVNDVMGGDADNGEQAGPDEVEGGAVIFDQKELEGLINCESEGVEQGTSEGQSEGPKRQIASNADKIFSESDKDRNVEHSSPLKKKKRHPMINPGDVRNQHPFRCIFCEKDFHQKSNHDRHLIAHTREKAFMCRKCGNCFGSKNALKVHIHAIHKSKGCKAFPCVQCSKRFDTENYLKAHVFKEHPKTPKLPKLNCEHCGKLFGLKANLDLHLRRVHLEERPHLCHFCSMSFFTEYDLRRHVSTHTGERNLKCHICDQGFKRKDHLARHIERFHGDAKENVADQVAIEAAVAVTTGEGESKE